MGKNHAVIEYAIKSLEMQIPKKPYKIVITDTYNIVCYGCPCCDCPVSKDEKYVCSNCGQKLDWN